LIGRPILTAAEMRCAEAAAVAAGTPVELLMDRAGTAAADAIERFAGPLPTLVLCGPGNNGGDGYVVARRLKERGVPVRVAASASPSSPAALAAREAWNGETGTIAAAEPAPLLVDALFGTGLKRSLDPDLVRRLHDLAAASRAAVAIDLPSGVSTDDGATLSDVPDFDLTITFATLKPAHLLQPAARYMGRIVVADIGIAAETRLHEIAKPSLARPGPDDHKYSRGYVAVAAGAMPGAAALAASAAARAGAGYVRLTGNRHVADVPLAVVQGGEEPPIDDERIGAFVIGPGLGLGEKADGQLNRVLAAAAPAIVDADALTLLARDRVQRLQSAKAMPILTPHAGEFRRLFLGLDGSKVEQARAAAERSGAVIVYKGSDTVVAAPDGRAAISRPGSPWLATAGTGDVLSGTIAAMRARGLPAFEAACAGIWLHGRAAETAGSALIADDLLRDLPRALAECL
jgi:hydroxyethylthiazole kinase-like uncharacterized protein yjeF